MIQVLCLMESKHLTRRVALLSFVDLNHCKQRDEISERMYCTGY
jgi:hypothetical protein